MVFVSRKQQKYSLLVSLFIIISIYVLVWSQNFSSKIDWNNYELMKSDEVRVGFGEHGRPETLTNKHDIEKNEQLFEDWGMSVVISDRMSVNRSLTDFRHEECLKIKYLRNLPKVSIIIIFNNELFSVFKRTLHSLYNRTPHELIEEVILVNDFSTLDFLYGPLENYIRDNFPLIKFIIVNMTKRVGLMRARVEGAKRATSNFLFISEPHCELTYNWLPPLLEPHLKDERIVTVPIIDNIEYTQLYHYGNDMGNLGSRGVFDWKLEYTKLFRISLSDDIQENLKPFPIPVMTGGVYLIRKEYFFEIGPYDEELLIWGGENIEMSLKIHLCGGKLLEVPCSHVAHMYRAFTKSRKHENGTDFTRFNRKRIVEVWFDDYKKIVYEKDPKLERTEAGDLTAPRRLKEELECKPFQYFLDVIAPDLLEKYPLVAKNFASGQIQLENSNFCLQGKFSPSEKVNLLKCVQPHSPSQNFELTWYHELSLPNTDLCLDTATVMMTPCHKLGGNQFFRYDLKTKQIIGGTGKKCLEANEKLEIFVTKCDDLIIWQKWNFLDYKNVEMLENDSKYGNKFNDNFMLL